MTLSDAIARLQYHAGQVGMSTSPTYPHEDEGMAKYSIAYEVRGQYIINSAGFALDFPIVALEMHLPRATLATDVQNAMTYRIPFCQRLRDDVTLNNTVICVNDITYEFGRLGDMEDADIGYRFFITLKMEG